MFLVNTRQREEDGTFGHGRLNKGEYGVYKISKKSDGGEAEEKTLQDVPVDKDTLLLVHGFNNDFIEVTAAYLNFAKRVHNAGFNGNVIGFTWPSYGEWSQYFGDREQVEYASFAFLNFVLKYRPLLAGQKFHINTHSMGAHLVIRALAAYSRIDAIAAPQPGKCLIDELIFFAADVDNEILEKGEDGNHAAAEAARLTSYFSYKDPVLSISQIVNHDDRLGLGGAERPRRLPKNAFQIDCATLIESHSGYRDSADVMDDVAEVLNGKLADQIAGRRASQDKNTFAIGPEEEQEDEDFDE
ncbi:MAG: alpha/beta hydrolase [Candidatus Binatia bacterium]